jgi:hypothetical protein
VVDCRDPITYKTGQYYSCEFEGAAVTVCLGCYQYTRKPNLSVEVEGLDGGPSKVLKVEKANLKKQEYRKLLTPVSTCDRCEKNHHTDCLLSIEPQKVCR